MIRRMLSTSRKVLAGAATAAVVGGVTTAAVAPANAATAQCGASCISVFSSALGTYADVGVVEAVLDGGVARVGQPVGLKQVSGTDPSEDFRPGVAGGGNTVSAFYADGMVSAEANSRFGSLQAVQQRYAPLGVETGLCVGVARVVQGEGLTLQPCETPGTTVWIIYPAPAGTAPGYFAIVNAATTAFSRPFAMHLPRDGVVHGAPLQMELRRLQYRSGDKMLPASQVWGAVFGPRG